MKKNTLVASLLGVTALVAAFAVTTTAPAKAEAKSVDDIAFTMKAGASIRLTEDTGIRFTAEMTPADYAAIVEYYDSVEFGTFIMPAAYATLKAEFVEGSFFGEDAVYTWEGKEGEGSVQVLQMDAAIDTTGTNYVVNGSVIDVYAKNLGMPYAGVCYVKGVKDGVEDIRLADANADGSRAVVEVAQNAIASGEYAEDEATLTGIINNYISWYETVNGEKPTAEYTVNVYYNDVKVDTKEESAVLNSEVTFVAPEEGLVAEDKGTTSGTVLYNGSLVLDVYYKAELAAPTVSYTRNAEGKLVATWTEVAGAESYEVYYNDEKVTEGVDGNTFTSENGGFVSVKAVKENWIAKEAEIWMDGSYLKVKGENRIYLSDFNDENSVNLWTNAGKKPWGQPSYVVPTLAYGNITCAYVGQAEGTNGGTNGTAYGVKVTNGGGDYASGRYTLPNALDLRSVDKIYVKAVTAQWGYNPNTFFYFENGTNAYKALPFASFVRESDYNNELNATPTVQSSETWNSGNFYAVNLIFDVQAMLANADFMAAFGGYTLTSIVAGSAGGKTILYDEIYYSEVSLDKPEVSYTRNMEGKLVVSWDKVAGATSYEVKVNGTAYAGYTGGESFIYSETSSATVTVQAVAPGVKPSETASVYVDASYLATRTGGGVYLSNFNSADDYKMWEGIDPGSYKARSWLTPGQYTPTAVETSTSVATGEQVTGVKFVVNVNDALTKYSLPNALDLTTVKEIVIVIDTPDDMQYNIYSVGFIAGTTKYNALPLTSILKYGATEATAVTGTYIAGPNGSRRWSFIINVADNLATLQTALGGNIIDGILMTSGASGNTTYVDEIYYTPVSANA